MPARVVPFPMGRQYRIGYAAVNADYFPNTQFPMISALASES
jgi:hypothetical protein